MRGKPIRYSLKICPVSFKPIYTSIPPTITPKKQPHHLFLHNNNPDNISSISIIQTTGVVFIEVRKEKYTNIMVNGIAGKKYIIFFIDKPP